MRKGDMNHLPKTIKNISMTCTLKFVDLESPDLQCKNLRLWT